MRVGEELRHRRRNGARHGAVGKFEHMHRFAERARHRREFEPDEPGAGNNDLVCIGEHRTDRVGIGKRAQAEDAVQISAGDRQRAVMRAERQHEVIVIERAAARQRDALVGAVDRGDARLRDDLNAIIGEEFLRTERQRLGRCLAHEIGFRQRRALVGQARLVSDDHDAPGKSVLAQRGGGLKPRLAGAGDDDRSQQNRPLHRAGIGAVELADMVLRVELHAELFDELLSASRGNRYDLPRRPRAPRTTASSRGR